jgi:ribonuclease E
MEAPAVKAVAPSTPAPEHRFVEIIEEKSGGKEKKPGLFNRLISSLFGSEETPEQPARQSGEQTRARRTRPEREPVKDRPARSGTARNGQAQGRRRSGNQSRQASGRPPRRETPPREERAQEDRTQTPPEHKPEQKAAPEVTAPSDTQAGPVREGERTERNQGRSSSRRGRRGGRNRPSGQRRGNDKTQERVTDASPSGRTDSGGTTVTGAQTPPHTTVSTPAGEQPGNVTEQPGKPVAATGSTAPQPSRDGGSSAQKNVDNAAAPAVSAIAGRDRKPAGETSMPPSPVEKVEVKVDKASS